MVSELLTNQTPLTHEAEDGVMEGSKGPQREREGEEGLGEGLNWIEEEEEGGVVLEGVTRKSEGGGTKVTRALK